MYMIVMRLQIDLDEKLLSQIQDLANKDRRKRKQMIELLIEKAVQT